MFTKRVSPVVIDGQRYFPLEKPEQLPREFGSVELFVRNEVPVRFTRVADNTWVVHRADRPGSTGVLVDDPAGDAESETGVGVEGRTDRLHLRFIYSAAAAAEVGLPDWRIPLQRVSWDDFLKFFASRSV
ncbi:hypothetical protein [Pseudoclavibacter sp. 13-3]|uniref:hypothetical protein n=1 Tax=Pseudoclavibacter sp. 13-3 TaxID=2901228 RepID=UPI001E4A2ACA|nr:hypothetical protein [Pseudoclavibacter sp. 13-3]MCD7102029.1 hypothetical protein [Pseudoclavibacter sp. 13-3]